MTKHKKYYKILWQGIKKGFVLEKLSKSLENYLFTINKLIKKNVKLTPKALGAELGYNKASTLEAVKILKKKKLVNYFPYQPISLTNEGEKYAKKIEEKREIISKFLNKVLFLEGEALEKTLFSIEYDTDEFFISRLKNFLDFLEFCPEGAPNWFCGIKNFIENGEIPKDCADCIEKAINKNL